MHKPDKMLTPTVVLQGAFVYPRKLDKGPLGLAFDRGGLPADEVPGRREPSERPVRGAACQDEEEKKTGASHDRKKRHN